MAKYIKLTTPLSEADIRQLSAGDEVRISGNIYTARDMAHKRLCQALRKKKTLPFELDGSVIYYAGPTPPPPGKIIGAAGPTTSARMDPFSKDLFANGLRATIGKGYRSKNIREALKKYGTVHLSATGGAGALLNKHIVSCEVIAYEDLATEAIRKLEVVDFPAIVAYDANGNSAYKEVQI